ncbi:hypothetical protein CGLO_18221 [Colletotrichum gloeosporioides Cg-14]|uniref:Uncharacterized protein n=1 Tax=Colletotrichum gloeosporioides (strain Cg-14) TaxID=1237896 RepID=T0JRY6_COLGC|nr:hypothetical protein CGLO_18221 [Colletotrichum gloeosporioides Cg-14]
MNIAIAGCGSCS